MRFFIESSQERGKPVAFPQVVDGGHDKVDCSENRDRANGDEGKYNPGQPFGPCRKLKVPPIRSG